MANSIFSNHPMFTQAQTVADICKPLEYFNINMFSHVQINKQFEMMAINSHPEFVENYLNKNYHNADIHAAKNNQLGEFVLWDTLNCTGDTSLMLQDAADFKHKHFFTIIEKDSDNLNFYHFSSNSSSFSMNQLYLNNLDELKKFILYFNEKVNSSKELSRAFDFKLAVENQHNDCHLLLNGQPIDLIKAKTNFLQAINHQNQIKLSKQQTRCLDLLVKGYTAKQIAEQLQLSKRTVEAYLNRIKEIYGCNNIKKLIASYFKG